MDFRQGELIKKNKLAIVFLVGDISSQYDLAICEVFTNIFRMVKELSAANEESMYTTWVSGKGIKKKKQISWSCLPCFRHISI